MSWVQINKNYMYEKGVYLKRMLAILTKYTDLFTICKSSFSVTLPSSRDFPLHALFSEAQVKFAMCAVKERREDARKIMKRHGSLYSVDGADGK